MWVRMRLPISIFVSVSLFTAETTAALYLSSTYRSAGDRIWQALTLLFTLVPSVLVQLTLTFIHRDLGRDRPLVLLLHILQLGPIVRSVASCSLASGVFFSRKPKKPFDAFSSDDSAFLHCNRPLYGSLLHTYGGYMDLYCIYACEHNKQLMWQLWWMHCAHVCCCHFSAALTTDDSDDLRDFRSQLKKNTHTHILKLND